MRHPHTDPRLTRWLHAETTEDERAADDALAALLAAMPRPVAPPGFADRVLARAAAPAPWPLERLALGILLLCGLAVAATPVWLAALWERCEPELAISWLAGVLVDAASAIGDLAPLGAGLAKIARWAALAAGTPEVLAFLAFCALLAATAGRLLVSLLDERSAGHAQV